MFIRTSVPSSAATNGCVYWFDSSVVGKDSWDLGAAWCCLRLTCDSCALLLFLQSYFGGMCSDGNRRIPELRAGPRVVHWDRPCWTQPGALRDLRLSHTGRDGEHPCHAHCAMPTVPCPQSCAHGATLACPLVSAPPPTQVSGAAGPWHPFLPSHHSPVPGALSDLGCQAVRDGASPQILSPAPAGELQMGGISINLPVSPPRSGSVLWNSLNPAFAAQSPPECRNLSVSSSPNSQSLHFSQGSGRE